MDLEQKRLIVRWFHELKNQDVTVKPEHIEQNPQWLQQIEHYPESLKRIHSPSRS